MPIFSLCDKRNIFLKESNNSDAEALQYSSPALRNDDKLLNHIAQMKVKRDTMVAEMEAAERQLSELQQLVLFHCCLF